MTIFVGNWIANSIIRHWQNRMKNSPPQNCNLSFGENDAKHPNQISEIKLPSVQ